MAGGNEDRREMRALLLHFGANLWTDEWSDKWKPLRAKVATDHLQLDEALWRETTDRMAAGGLNTVVIDIAEALIYPSHPELAVRGSWSVERFRAELARLRKIGLTPIPKLNFSTAHDTWLKEYGRMVSTPEYYRVCCDLIRDVCEVFDHPEFLHIGFDEEMAEYQKKYVHCVMRQGELWWHDFLFFVKTCEDLGMRAWAWSDYGWWHPCEYVKRTPRSVLLSDWYYSTRFDLQAAIAQNHWALRNFIDFDNAGFDQVPTGTYFNTSLAENFPRLVDFCDAHIAPHRLKELHVTAMPKSGSYPACYGMKSYSGDYVKDFYGHVIVHPGSSSSDWAYFYVQTDNDSYEKTLIWHGELSGDGFADFSSGKYSTSKLGTWKIYSVATNFHGAIRLYSFFHDASTSKYTQFYLNDARTLGGTYAGTAAWRSIWFTNPFVHIVGDMDVTEPTRGLCFDSTVRLDVQDGKEFALHLPTTFNGTVNKIGAGALKLGGKACYLNAKGTNNTGNPASGKNVLNMLEGSLCVDATNAVDGLAITFSAGASLVLPADSANESLKAKGMFNVKWSAPLAFEDAKLKVVFTNAAESVAPDGRFTRGICTLKTAVVTSLGLTAESFSVTPPFRSERVKVLGVTSATDAATDTVTFSATFGKIGSMLILR